MPTNHDVGQAFYAQGDATQPHNPILAPSLSYLVAIDPLKPLADRELCVVGRL